VNVYGLKQEKKKNTVYPLKVVDEEKHNHFDLLLITNDKNRTLYLHLNLLSSNPLAKNIT